MSEPVTAFHDLDAYVALPRVTGLHLAPDGSRLVAQAAALGPDGTAYVSALWDVDPAGARAARRLTRSAKGESFAAFTHDGTVLFTSARPDPDAKDNDDDAPPSLWALPAIGEARLVGARRGGWGAVVAAKHAPTVLALAATLPGSADGADTATDDGRRKQRKDRKVSAILHETYPVRFWDADLGPDAPRLLAADLAGDPDPAAERIAWRDLSGHASHGLRNTSIEVSDDGTAAFVSWERPETGGSLRSSVVGYDIASGERRVLLDDPDHEYVALALSPDARVLAVEVYERHSPEQPGNQRLAVLDLAALGQRQATLADVRFVAPEWDRWVSSVSWTPDGTALVVTADDAGRAPIFRIDLDSADPGQTDPTDTVTRLTGDDAAYHDVSVAPDGTVYALRSAIDSPAVPVRLDSVTPDQQPEPLLSPAPALTVPGHVEEVHGTAEDGTPIRAWLCLPGEASAADAAAEATPAPLALWIHGGPLASWNDWSWRWSPWIMVAQGYAVLLPDPGLSTGYGLDFVARGWGSWGNEPYTDIMRLTDVACEHPAVDASRTAVMGGSFGGYMTNWVLGQTDRFDVAVTHASLYALDQFGPTTDAAYWWMREMTPEMEANNSPHLHIDKWSTPTLVIHGDRDYRVPIGEALRLWWDLAERSGDDDGVMPHKFLYFPDENHWILTPEHSKVWYSTVLAFVDHHVKGTAWATPDLLR